ncbi:PH domain-containing protein [Algibacter pacificus]|uniref:PH domain-containing protein n=1 Tax=Algibacter pacificus TaxID=2599389 RepID=UPI00165079EC|nr:PH domain-containing protein [Algibacter pacificus]
MIYKSEPLEAVLSVGGIFLLVYGLCLYLNFSTKYTITESGILEVICGFLYHKRFDIKKIKSVAKTGNLMSSPAPSLDRIELTYGKFDVIVISPKDKNEFARALQQVNPEIENKLKP